MNLSVTGVLLQLEQPYEMGERVEVEIDFLAQPESTTVVTGVGCVVREHGGDPHYAAIHFDVDCTPGHAGYRASRARRAALNDFTPSAT